MFVCIRASCLFCCVPNTEKEKQKIIINMRMHKYLKAGSDRLGEAILRIRSVVVPAQN